MYSREIEVDVLRDLPGFGLHRVVFVNNPAVGGSRTPIPDGFDIAPLVQGKQDLSEKSKTVQYTRNDREITIINYITPTKLVASCLTSKH